MTLTHIPRRFPRVAVALVQPEIPGNTGNIGRTCLGFDTELHLIRPIAFSLESRDVKRAGLDYWPKLNLHVHENFEMFSKTSLLEFESAVLFSKESKLGAFCSLHINNLTNFVS